jgi:formylglycine-generating enzyme required for sulfatase activity
MALKPGAVINQRYRVECLLEQGGFGAIYRAWDLALERTCALKENLDTSSEARQQFEREAKILAGLSHPNLPRVTDHFFIPNQGQYLVMDLVEGQDLQALLDDAGAPLAEDQALDWISQVCDALDYLHGQTPPVIHRDIKPANIRLTPGGQAMLVDFGIAKIYHPTLKTTVGARAVTPGFSPYEQYGKGVTDARSDVYALGATLYTLLSAEEPVESIQRVVRDPLPALEKVNPAVSLRTAQAIKKAMSMDPQQRFQSAAEFKAALEPEAKSLPIQPWIRGMGVVAVVLLLVALLLWRPVLQPALMPQSQPSLSTQVTASPAWMSAAPVTPTLTSTAIPVTATPSPTLTSPPTQPPWVYVVQPGDTCQALALRYRVLIREIVQLNNLDEDCNRLLAGQQLLLPYTDTFATMQALTTTATLASQATRLASRDEMAMALIPAGAFLMGSGQNEPGAQADEKPQRTIYLDEYWIDLTEVTNAMYARCVRSGACDEPAQRSSNTRLFYYRDERYANYPVIHVSWQDAQAYCQWAGRRLPTEAEWEKAARGPDGLTYPWGELRPDGSLVNFDQRVGDTTPVGYYPAGASPYGVLDMAGNVAEWVADWYAADFYDQAPAVNPFGPAAGEYRVLRGGSWFSPARAVRAAFRVWNLPDLGYDSSGFRCAADR